MMYFAASSIHCVCRRLDLFENNCVNPEGHLVLDILYQRFTEVKRWRKCTILR